MTPAPGAARWDALPSEGTTAFVATTEVGVTGFVAVGPSRDDEHAGLGIGEIRAIYAVPTWWGSGAGQMLLTTGLEALGDVPVILWVLTQNTRALYGPNGFEPDGATLDYARAAWRFRSFA